MRAARRRGRETVFGWRRNAGRAAKISASGVRSSASVTIAPQAEPSR